MFLASRRRRWLRVLSLAGAVVTMVILVPSSNRDQLLTIDYALEGGGERIVDGDLNTGDVDTMHSGQHFNAGAEHIVNGDLNAQNVAIMHPKEQHSQDEDNVDGDLNAQNMNTMRSNTSRHKVKVKDTMHPVEDQMDFNAHLANKVTMHSANKTMLDNDNRTMQKHLTDNQQTVASHSDFKVLDVSNITHSHNCSVHLYHNVPTTTPPFKLYIYDLPPEFNTQLLDCMQMPGRFPGFTVDSCGFGGEFHPEVSGVTIRETWQFSLDVILHHKLLHSPYRTHDPEEADVFFIPFYEASNCFCRWERNILYEGEQLENALIKVIQRLPYYSRGRPHLITVAKIEREERSQRCNLLKQPWTYNVTLIGIEHDEWSHNAPRRGDFIVAPYPSYGHLTSPDGGRYVETLFQHDRRVFVFMAAGSRRTNKFRNIILDQFPNITHNQDITEYYHTHNIQPQTRLKSVWLETQDSNYKAHQVTMDWMKNSVFCAQPAGDSPTRKSVYDAINSGCIPILFEVDFYPHVTYPFDSVLHYGNFTVKVPFEKAGNFGEVLQEYESRPDKVRTLQANLKEVIKWMQYGYPVDNRPHEDAVKMIMDEVERRVVKKSSQRMAKIFKREGGHIIEKHV